MSTGRVEAFSDGVIAVIITIMVLELKVPGDTTTASLAALLPLLFVYTLSFLVVAIMWVNHHHFLRTAKRADAPLLWANNNLLFWMSLIPFATAYMGKNHGAPLAVAFYGVVLALACGAFLLLQIILAKHNAGDPARRAQYRRLHRKSILSIALYLGSVGSAFISVYVSFVVFVSIPILYFLPERKLHDASPDMLETNHKENS